MALRPNRAKGLAFEYFPDFLAQRVIARQLDDWARGDQDRKSSLYVPRHYNTNDEYDDLMERSPTPWLALGVSTLAQTMYVEGIRRKGSTENLQSWDIWQQNRWDSRQNPLYRSTMAHGIAYNWVQPGRLPLNGEKTALFRGLSALTTAAWYDEVDDEWPVFVIHAVETLIGTDPAIPGWKVDLIDEVYTHHFLVAGEGQNLRDWTYVDSDEHDLGVPPVVRYTNMTDLDGRHTGEIEPLIPLAKRIDQDTFDRLIVQRFGAWKVRFITGLQRPQNMTETQYQAGLLKMKINDFLVASSDKTKFGTLDETSLDGFIKARDSDLRDLAAVMQMPPYMFLGLSANLQAESLAAARSALAARSLERRTTFGESHEQSFRLAAKIVGNQEESRAYDMQVRWRDQEVRSLSQAADALGKLGSQVGVPTEMLWERIPGWTDSDTVRAKALVTDQGFDAIIAEFEQQMAGAGQTDQLGTIRGRQVQIP